MQLLTLRVELRGINPIPLAVLPPSPQPLIFGSQRNSISLFLDERASRQSAHVYSLLQQSLLCLQRCAGPSTCSRASS